MLHDFMHVCFLHCHYHVFVFNAYQTASLIFCFALLFKDYITLEIQIKIELSIYNLFKYAKFEMIV